MKKIKILLYGISKTYGGIESIVYNICKNMSELFVFDVLCDYDTCAYSDFFKSRGGQLFFVSKRGDNPIKHTKDVKKFFIENKNYDYVWVNTASASNITVQKHAKKYTNAKVITHSHGTRIEGSGIKYKLNIFLHKLNYKKMMQLSDYKFACSKLAGEYLFGKNCSSVYVLKNGIDLLKNKFSVQERNALRQDFGFDEKLLVLGIIGRLSAVKNHKKAFEIFKNLINRIDCRLLVIGDGELREELENVVDKENLQQKIIFLGYRDDVDKLLNAMDCVLMPSFHEGLPVVGIEAQCNGAHCFLSDTITQELNVSEYAHFFNINDSSEFWVDNIIEISTAYNDRSLAYKKVKECGYDIVDIANELEGLLQSNVQK